MEVFITLEAKTNPALYGTYLVPGAQDSPGQVRPGEEQALTAHGLVWRPASTAGV